MPRNSAAKAVVKLREFIPHARMEVLRPFQKYKGGMPEITPSFIYLQQSGLETAEAEPLQRDADVYIQDRDFDLMRHEAPEHIGALFRAYGRHTPFTTGELNVLVERGFIRLYVK